MAATNVYIRLLGEGICVYRRLPADKISDRVYVIGGEDVYDPDDEDWEFLPGSRVVVEAQVLQGEKVLIAVERARD